MQCDGRVGLIWAPQAPALAEAQISRCLLGPKPRMHLRPCAEASSALVRMSLQGPLLCMPKQHPHVGLPLQAGLQGGHGQQQAGQPARSGAPTPPPRQQSPSPQPHSGALTGMLGLCCNHMCCHILHINSTARHITSIACLCLHCLTFELWCVGVPVVCP